MSPNLKFETQEKKIMRLEIARLKTVNHLL